MRLKVGQVSALAERATVKFSYTRVGERDGERVEEPETGILARHDGAFVAYVNRCGIEADTVYCGRSCLVGPDGKEILRAGKSTELLIADVDSQAIASARETNPVLNDRRPDLYRVWG